MSRTALLAVLAVGMAAGLAFGLHPEWDLEVALFFHRPEVQAAHARLSTWSIGFREGAKWIIAALAAPACLAVIAKIAWPQRPMLLPGRAAALMILTLALGPGLLVNVILKSHWPRPRPEAVRDLGGPLPFVAWWDPGGGCTSNCSFVSGEVAGAAWTLLPAILVPPPWRAIAVGGSLLFTAGVAVQRVAQERHFVSDTLFAAVFVWLLIWGTHVAVFREKPAGTEDAVERALASVGRRIRGGRDKTGRAPPTN